MAGHSDRPSDSWGNDVAKGTFVFTAVLTILFAGAVFAFVLR